MLILFYKYWMYLDVRTMCAGCGGIVWVHIEFSQVEVSLEPKFEKLTGETSFEGEGYDIIVSDGAHQVLSQCYAMT